MWKRYGNQWGRFSCRNRGERTGAGNRPFVFLWNRRIITKGSTEKSIDFTLYSADGKVVHQGFDKRIPNAKEWSYSAVFKDAGSCYIIEKPIPGYITRYVNVGEYAGITDRCYNGGTIINKRIPKTGDETPLLLWAGMLLVGASGLTVALTVSKRRKAHK